MANQIMVVEKVQEIDLLQQALAGAEDELIETSTLDHQVLNQAELLNILQGDNSTDSQTIQLTVEQAEALGLRLEVDPCTDGDCNEEIGSELSEDECNDNVNHIQLAETFDINDGNYIQIPLILSSENEIVPPITNDVIKNITINSSKPLGTSQNPIQLINQNGVLKSVQQLTPEQLTTLQNVLRNQNLTSELKDTKTKQIQNIFYNPEAKTRIVYRTVFPEELDLQTPRRGRPSKRGRPKKTDEKPVEREPSPEIPVAKPIRTRSGRVTKPPRHKNFRPLHEIDTDNIDGTVTVVEEPKNDIEPKEDKQSELEHPKPILFSGLPKQKRNISAQYRCPTCKKAYVGFNRMERHLKLFPDHGPLPIKRQRANLWETSLKLARSAPPGSRGVALLNDLSSLIQNIQKISSNFIRPSDEKGHHYEINESLGLLLRIPPGKYSINESAIFETKSPTIENDSSDNVDKKLPTESLQEQLLNVQIVPHSENENLILPVVDTDTGQVPMATDEIISVDQLVNERFHSLTATDLTPTCPSTGPSLNLDLSLDLFQFNPS